MAVRNIVSIDAERCNGCGLCVRACIEGAIKLIEGKAMLVSDEYCDGLGACLPACPAGAIKIEQREAPAFDEQAALAHVAREVHTHPGARDCHAAHSCPSARPLDLHEAHEQKNSQLSHWPVQLALVPPQARFLKDADVILCADCVPFAYKEFHRDFLEAHTVLVACPKLDDVAAHTDRIAAILRESGLKSLTVLRMEVPCCSALMRAARQAAERTGNKIPLHEIVITIRGNAIA
jgi:Fe-S-cluster-containing hydrogenase component 2